MRFFQQPHKICIVTSRFPPQHSAVGDYALRLSEALVGSGMEVCVLTSMDSAGMVFREGIHVSAISKGWGIRGVGQIIKFLRRERPHIVNLQYVPHMYSRYGLALSIALLPLAIRCILNLPVVTTCHEFVGPRSRTLKDVFLQMFYIVQTFLLLLGSQRVIVPLERHMEILQTSYGRLARKARLIPVGSNIPVCTINKEIPTRENNSQQEKWTMTTLGTGHSWWNYELALQTLAHLREKGYKINLTCIGDIEGANPSYFKKLRALVNELDLNRSVSWTGYRTAEEVSAFLSETDVFFFTQISGATMRSTSLMAALSHGLAVMATRGADTDRFLLDSGAIIFVPADASEQAASQMEMLMSDIRKRCEWGQRAKELYERKFSWNNIASQYKEVFLDAS